MAFSDFTSQLCFLSYPRLHNVGRGFIMCLFSVNVEPAVQSCVYSTVLSPGLKRLCIIPLRGEEFSELCGVKYWITKPASYHEPPATHSV